MRSIQPSKENIQHVKKWNLITFLWIIFSLLDPHQGTPFESGSNPDPQHCLKLGRTKKACPLVQDDNLVLLDQLTELILL